MKYFSKILLLASVVVIAMLYSCKKDSIPYQPNGKAVSLTSNVTTIAPTSAMDSSIVLTLNWTNPGYSTDSANQKFIIEMDSSGRNFTHEVTFEVDGPASFSLTGNQLNNVLANYDVFSSSGQKLEGEQINF